MTDYYVVPEFAGTADLGPTGCQVTVLGRCSLCGGTVSTPAAWGGTDPPVGCESCGAEAVAGALPVIPMVRPVRWSVNTSGLVIGDTGCQGGAR